ncbi:MULTISPECIES: acyl-homoserine-lactone synthase [Pseudomonas]|uniref:Acyl-homoserine-lactone synthase n=1 Tax=Pseudomonas taiwanensis TaxID=470150 RepID=A0ABR6V4M5_9PSED|nr:MULTISPECIES: acyl-homoserine-lactone synthase [Pseudomonas]MBC3474787.1 GNAT family N-acetyltransferase [Pseudomonas taiwanensis]MBC3491298.1 GNAT family N-acetyltransferase [Pseudomonas taiwanensis]MDT8926129.1 acyl-homoserine-lactone synthase [Pseudomonas taiwanensis]MPT02471.1 GNAT family N-acetyltransferase [Pseudomonas sp.]QQZ36844.1 GNAT family N-acetyltransferase [Pseudomonas sp. SK2]
MDIVIGTRQQLGSARLAQMERYRYRVFVDELGWDLTCEPQCERDQFDHDNTLYLLACNGRDDIVGTARLLPTHRPYLLDEVFPQLMAGQALPHSAQVWELSRFAAMDFAGPGLRGRGQFSSTIAVQLLDAVLRCAAGHGAQRLITVSPLGIERLLRRAGYRYQRAAAPVRVGAHWLFACWLDVAAQPYTIGEVTKAPACRSMHRAA